MHPETGEQRLDLLWWGPAPHFTKDLKTCKRPINARSKTIANSGMFRGAFASRRSLVPVDAFYEWKALPRLAWADEGQETLRQSTRRR